jgi:hypothetical protein
MKKTVSKAISRGFALWLFAVTLSACALKGSKAEEKYDGKSTCSKPGFTCGMQTPGLNSGLHPTAEAQTENSPTFEGRSNNYAPLCRMKNDKCECQCQPTP